MSLITVMRERRPSAIVLRTAQTRLLMKADIKHLHSFHVEDSLDLYWPDDPTDFGTWIRLFIGPVGEEASDTFDLLVCTPLWLAYNVKREPGGGLWGRHMLIVTEYDPDRIKACAMRLVSGLSDDAWTPIAEKIARFAAWEFEDYQE